MTTETQRFWDQQASSFDEDPDHGLRDPIVRLAWYKLLSSWLPTPGRAILDIGCGTGSLSTLLAELGHEVTGIDFSPAMIAVATAKARAAGQTITFQHMDASEPHFPAQQFDGLLCRHLLWALPEPALVLRRWVKLLKPGGQLLLIEGFWQTGGGLHAEETVAALPAGLINVVTQPLHHRPELWGKTVADERYAVLGSVG